MAEKAEMINASVVTLYLEGWQKRMVRDYLKSLKFENKPFSKIMIDLRKKGHLNSYRVPTIKPGEEIEVIELYFTDAQKVQIEEATGLKIVDTVQITKAFLETETVMFR